MCAAHGGGYLTSYLGRSDAACVVRDDANCANKRKPSEYFKDQIVVDSMVFSSEGLRHLVAETGVSQVVYGSDMPYFWPDTIDIVVEAPFLERCRQGSDLGRQLAALAAHRSLTTDGGATLSCCSPPSESLSPRCCSCC